MIIEVDGKRIESRIFKSRNEFACFRGYLYKGKRPEKFILDSSEVGRIVTHPDGAEFLNTLRNATKFRSKAILTLTYGDNNED